MIHLLTLINKILFRIFCNKYPLADLLLILGCPIYNLNDSLTFVVWSTRLTTIFIVEVRKLPRKKSQVCARFTPSCTVVNDATNTPIHLCERMFNRDDSNMLDERREANTLETLKPVWPIIHLKSTCAASHRIKLILKIHFRFINIGYLNYRIFSKTRI